METTVQVRHNIEVAHRLSQLPGKCENIHGHSMWVTLSIRPSKEVFIGEHTGIFLEFGSLKARFREYLDSYFDHHLLLYEEDELIDLGLPGVVPVSGDPTTENIAAWVYSWAQDTYGALYSYRVEVQETSVNFATVGDF